MVQFLTFMQSFFADKKRDDKGATAVEYGLLVALIAAVIVTTVGLLGDEILAAFNDVLTALQAR